MMFRPRRFLFAGLLQLGALVVTAQTPAIEAPPVRLEQYQVNAAEDDSFDGTGMGTFDAELSDAPFANDLILGPCLPLAGFNANGPAGDIVRRSTITALQFDGAPRPGLSVRVNLEGWARSITRDHYPHPVLDLDTGLFSGVLNALDHDLLASNARTGAGREYSLAARVMF
jgi:hypothetical protein